ncbi:Regulator of protease activity HflC, stomatin/prohibitin superfamily (plasmid) [Nostoc flagelliforme CCNUN1]|uniref:Regulator of protease activity HflC, stomatin/prohibitin superfamily n=1 Tax=Nostoc flagelliforme CCNUN1 TaxID=2038116 RepID=A0A2K8TB65_9NOSO|nr:Regulator of protease activity HflC, stomatin/prohibitin superfamily [Nostoc flagelliforme CCNUN1]
MASYNLIVDDVSLVNFAFSPKFSTAIESKQILEQKAKQTEFIAQKATQEVQPEINPAKGQESQTSNSWSLGIFLGILLLILFFIFRGRSGSSYRSSRGSGDGAYSAYSGGDGGGGGGGDGCGGGGDGGGGGCGD